MKKTSSARKGVAMAVGIAAPTAMAFTLPSQHGIVPARAQQAPSAQVAEVQGAPQGSTSAHGRIAAAGAVTLGGLLAAGAGRQQNQRRGSLPTISACSATAVLKNDEVAGVMDPVKKLEEYVKAKGGNKVLRKILIANNGMAATKAILSMRQWAYLELGEDNVFEFVAMATRDDLEANAEFIRLANTFVEVPSGKNVNNYANVNLICEIAKAQGVDAVWPGWGHASENPALPKKLKEMGVTFIGPTSSVMSVLGDKIAANILAQTAGVPCIPWSGDGLVASLQEDGTITEEVFKKGCVFSVAEAKASALRIGFPIMIKASEGGGGKGIRMIKKMEELESAFFQVQNEVVGSPIFMMQLCTGARHIEVQIMGDQHGNAVALSGRDCSTQRRFQKIFEEGPPSIVPRDTFQEMERAAQRLTQNLGYVGAGTVEYLYNVKDNKFFFLELNPRLQVEHPVTEEITRVNLPITQLLVCSGIPLANLPQIRSFYGKSPDDLTSPINFLEEDYVYPERHVIAARITAENPDDGFKPTSGKIQRIKFQSSVACWGYFSVGANGGIHEYADSQFGHVFAHGATREDARKALMLSLRTMDIVGEIRNPVEYLVELLKTEAFVKNTIDTSWLDGLLAAKSVAVKYNIFDIVYYAAIFRAARSVKAEEKEMLGALEKSQLGPLKTVSKMNTFPIDIAFEGKKYSFIISRLGPDLMEVRIGDQKFISQVLAQPDGTFFVSTGNTVTKVFGTEEALGLRLRLEGIGTVMLPTLYDPSELRSEFNGKIVRYLQDNGAAVKEGEPYVELEAMKMIMPVKATASGKISHTAGAGSIVSAGDILGALQLDDPTKVKKIVPFEGSFQPTAAEGDAKMSAGSLKSQVDTLLDGFVPLAGPASLVQQLFAETAQAERDGVAVNILDRFLSVEEKFSKLSAENLTDDQMFTSLINDNKDQLLKVADLSRAHSQMAPRIEVVLSTLRSVRAMTPSSELMERIGKLQELSSEGGYGQVSLLAKDLAEKVSSTPFAERQSALRTKLDTASLDFSAIAALSPQEGGAELLSNLLTDSSEQVRTNALEAMIRRLYRSFVIQDMEIVNEGPSNLTCTFKFQFPGNDDSTRMREALVKVVPSSDKIKDVVNGQISFEDSVSGSNTVKVIVTSTAERNDGSDKAFQSMIVDTEVLLKDADANLKSAGVREFGIFLTQAPNVPRYASFMGKDAWKENPSCRDMRPSFPNLLEVYRLAEDYDLDRIVPVAGRNSQVYLGTQRAAVADKGKKPATIFARLITHRLDGLAKGDGSWTAGAESILLAGVDEIERARLNSKVGSKPNSNIFVQFMLNVDMEPAEAGKRLEQFMDAFIAKTGARLQSSKVDEIVLKLGIGSGFTRKTTLRLTASSMTGEYLKTQVFLEKEDQIGQPISWSDPKTGEARQLLSLAEISRMQTRRLSARAAGSTYAAEFLGMMKLELLRKWDAYHASGGKRKPAANLFKSVELVLGSSGKLEESSRQPGQNNIGMVAWHCTMQTPEYPAGRDIVMIANDVTFQAGSFGVDEDEFFQKASQYARDHGLPRIHVACNSGARVGLAEELKPCIQVQWTDSEDPSKGFEYLYLSEEDYKSFPAGTVEARLVQAGGEKHYALDAIIGEGLKSTRGGIGVENLKGSGLIAGETARAYNEIFTLSYVTGRSVGIGAYLNRLGQRVIQMVNGPMILTGFGALNKLLGKNVYTSQDQLGGPQVMVPNGVTHKLVQSDSEGVSAILDWLSYVPKTTTSSPAILEPTDPVSRDVTFTPSKRPYDPRHMLAGSTSPGGEKLTGFFDEGSFIETLEGWGKSVVTGRAKLGGIPIGVIAVETRNVDRRVPADPANPLSQEVIEPQAGQVWFPDSAFKTATAIKDFNRGENLPLMIFANWRGFSGGTRDMYQEVLKYGAQIVDALVDYKHPVFVYIPPGGELRGGSWVVIDPSINAEQMEMYADVESRGGILEPAGIVEVKFRTAQQKEMMHRLDDQLQALDAQLKASSSTEFDTGEDAIQSQIKAREEKLAPLYTQIACEFADLHDRTGRMEAKGVIRKGLRWKRAREFFYWRVRARLHTQEVERQMCSADPHMSLKDAKELLASWLSEAGKGEDDQAACDYLAGNPFADKVQGVKIAATKRRMRELYESLPASEQASALL